MWGLSPENEGPWLQLFSYICYPHLRVLLKTHNSQLTLQLGCAGCSKTGRAVIRMCARLWSCWKYQMLVGNLSDHMLRPAAEHSQSRWLGWHGLSRGTQAVVLHSLPGRGHILPARFFMRNSKVWDAICWKLIICTVILYIDIWTVSVGTRIKVMFFILLFPSSPSWGPCRSRVTKRVRKTSASPSSEQTSLLRCKFDLMTVFLGSGRLTRERIRPNPVYIQL